MKERARKHEAMRAIENKGKRLEALIHLSDNLKDRLHRKSMVFNDFLYQASEDPAYIFRDIYQVFYDMIHYYIKEEHYKGSIPFQMQELVDYDCSALFEKGCDHPFFADRMFVQRLLLLANSVKSGTQNNYIFLFEGPPGSGKSTFLNNLLNKFEAYIDSADGAMYTTSWRLDLRALQGIDKDLAEKLENESESSGKGKQQHYIEFPCPNHDHPILQIPKFYRKRFLDELIQDGKFKKRLFHAKEYEWIFKETPCSICSSLYNSLLDKTDDPLHIFDMIRVKRVNYNRQFGEGVSIFNPGDPVYKRPIKNAHIQKVLDELFLNENVNYIYSSLAKTNNGVFALMDIKENNIDRLKELHGIVSDGIHKVELVEERIKSLFVGLVNPADKKHYEQMPSFKDRVITVTVPYVLDYSTEVKIYTHKFGEKIKNDFQPLVLRNFAKIIISTRMKPDGQATKNWLKKPALYNAFMDDNFLLLKMKLYTGTLPVWLDELDVKSLDETHLSAIYAESAKEGNQGFSGRQTLKIFNEFYNEYYEEGEVVGMEDVLEYFKKNKQLLAKIPSGFLVSLEHYYDFCLLQQIKESIYSYNKKQISDDILNYLFAVNFELGAVVENKYTGNRLEVTEEFFTNFEVIFTGTTASEKSRHEFRANVHQEYVSKTLAQEIRVENKKIEETEQYESLVNRFKQNIKENALEPYFGNDNFRRAIKDYSSPAFKSYDYRTRRDVDLLLHRMVNKFKYDMAGARKACIYAYDKGLHKKY